MPLLKLIFLFPQVGYVNSLEGIFFLLIFLEKLVENDPNNDLLAWWSMVKFPDGVVTQAFQMIPNFYGLQQFLETAPSMKQKSLPRWPHKHNLGKNPSHLRSPLYEILDMCMNTMSSAYLSISTCTYDVLLVHVYNCICIYAVYMYISTIMARHNHFYTIRLQIPAMYGQNSNTLLGYSPQIFHVFPLIIL